MKLRRKLTLLALGVSAAPLAIAGFWSLRISQRALRAALEENELTVAKQVAEHASGEFENLLSILRTDAHIFDLTRAGSGDAPSAQGMLKFLQGLPISTQNQERLPLEEGARTRCDGPKGSGFRSLGLHQTEQYVHF